MLLVRLQRCIPKTYSAYSLYRTYSSQKLTLPPLPSLAEWRQEFPYNTIVRRDRVSISNPLVARMLAQSFFKSESESSDGKGNVVIEAFPGPGVLSRALLELPASSLRKLIILEDDAGYLKYLMPLQEVDHRVTVIPISGHSWDAYSELESQGLLQDVEPAPWESPVPNLHFVSHLTLNIKGEQLIAQLFRSIPERSWLFKYGRVPMHILMSDWVWTRLSAGTGASSMRRCKLGVVGEATAAIEHAIPSNILEPYDKVFFPPVTSSGASRKPGQPMHAITSVPYAAQVIQKGQIDEWDYCLRKLFVLKNFALKDAINSLAPGARSILSQLTDPGLPREERVNVAKRVRDLNVADWTLTLRAFNKWPFKPSDIMISDAFLSDD